MAEVVSRSPAPAIEVGVAGRAGPAGHDLRTDLAEVVERHAAGLDAARPDVVARRHERGRRTARENVADLLDPDRSWSTARWWSPPSGAGAPLTT